jgi:hypothetical protein
MSNELHPIIAAALAPWTPPTEEQWLAADLARVRELNQQDYEQRRADRIERRDAQLVRAMAPRGLPGEPA